MKRLLRRIIGQHSPLRLGWHWSKALAAALRYGIPARKLTVIGVTGTDGKTTTVGMIAHILNASGQRTAALSTAFFQIGETIQWNATQKTSPSPMVVQAFLRRAVREGCTHAVLECSSHGLTQHRLNFTWPKVAVMTNLSEEHLDYHGTMDNYLQAKAKLFRMLRPDGLAVLNADDASCAPLVQATACSISTYGTAVKNCLLPRSATHIWIDRLEEGALITGRVQASHDQRERILTLYLAGRFNLQNALATISACLGCGVSIEASIECLKSFKGIPGRIERMTRAGAPFSAYIDFTVTPQSYTALLTTLRSSMAPGGRLFVLAGSCGDRMKEKRPIVGGILARLADVSIITNEDPYTEDPEAIIDAVLAGMPKDHPVYRGSIPQGIEPPFSVRVSDRRAAIEMLLREARAGDCVVFCGKGSDTTMMIGEQQVPWNEREIVTSFLASNARERT